MNTKLRRLICGVLLLALLLCVTPPAKVAAAPSDAKVEEVVQTIRDVYQGAREGSGWWSFFGYCGTMIGWQLHVMGITSQVIKANGREFYDIFAGQAVTSGGYPVRTYHGSQYSLEGALNAVSQNGTKDVYNILVGFEATPSQDGARYGHAMVVFAILDGIVYFNQSYAYYLNGTHYPEGAPIGLPIADFCHLFRLDTFDGIVHFGRQSYSEDCTYYPSYLDVTVTEPTAMYSEPCLDTADDRSQLLRPLRPGEPMTVTGLYVNPLGEYWYQVEEQRKIGYIPAQHTQVENMRYEDVTISGVDLPRELFQGGNDHLVGTLSATNNRITTVRYQLFALDGQTPEHVNSGIQSLDARRFSLYRSDLDYQLDLRDLKKGSYRLELAAVVGNSYYADGGLQTQWKTVKLWRSDFKVVDQPDTTHHVTLDAMGGNCSLNEATVSIGDRLKALPDPVRPGYVFGGWYTEDGMRVTRRTVIAEDTTLYAHWMVDETAAGWYLRDEAWVYLEQGVQKLGFIRDGDFTCYYLDDGSLATGWQLLEGKTYYFYPSGAMHTGWMDAEAGRSYFTANGAAVGWMVIDDRQYYFNEAGIMLTGRQTIDGKRYVFGDDGVLKGEK